MKRNANDGLKIMKKNVEQIIQRGDKNNPNNSEQFENENELYKQIGQSNYTESVELSGHRKAIAQEVSELSWPDLRARAKTAGVSSGHKKRHALESDVIEAEPSSSLDNNTNMEECKN